MERPKRYTWIRIKDRFFLYDRKIQAIPAGYGYGTPNKSDVMRVVNDMNRKHARFKKVS